MNCRTYSKSSRRNLINTDLLPTKVSTSPEYAPVLDDPALPRVLLIGDSISIAYTLEVRALLTGKANVHRPFANCGPTSLGLEHLDEWLGEKSWDLIHFNWGLHDMVHIDEHGEKIAPALGKPRADAEQFEKNLRELVRRLQATHADLIWCSITPVPPGERERFSGTEALYNAAAARIMAENNVSINDLHAFASTNLEKWQRPANVHFVEEGSSALAKRVTSVIEERLPSRTVLGATN